MDTERIEKLASFTENFKEFGFGGLEKEANEKHAKIVEAVLATGLKGELNIKLRYELSGANEIKVSFNLNEKIPRRRESMKMYADHRGMFLENPDQLSFDNVRQIDDKPKKIKQV